MQGNKFAPWFLLSGRLPPPRIGPSRGDKHHISGKDPPTSSHVAGHDSPESKTEASLEPRFPRGLALHHSVRFGTCSGFLLAAAEYGVKWGYFLFFFIYWWHRLECLINTYELERTSLVFCQWDTRFGKKADVLAGKVTLEKLVCRFIIRFQRIKHPRNVFSDYSRVDSTLQL